MWGPVQGALTGTEWRGMRSPLKVGHVFEPVIRRGCSRGAILPYCFGPDLRVSPDGQRFLMIKPVAPSKLPRRRTYRGQNWTES